MTTLAALKKKLADLEAQVERATKAEMGSAIAKVHKIMADFGLTIEHLAGGAPASKPAAKSRKTAKAPTKAKGAKPAKYRDPVTGVTWAGVGRTPRWIADADNRDEFLIVKPATGAAPVKAAASAKKSAKPAAPAKGSRVIKAAKKAGGKPGAGRKRVGEMQSSTPVAEKTVAKKAVAKKAASKKVASKKVAGKATRKRTTTASSASGGTPAESASA